MTSAANVVCMGESIGEVVQSSDASWSTQIFTYITWATFFSGDNPTVPTVALNFLLSVTPMVDLDISESSKNISSLVTICRISSRPC